MDFKKMLFSNPATTLAGVFSALGYILPMFGVPLSPAISQAIQVLGIALIGLFSHDAVNVAAPKQ